MKPEVRVSLRTATMIELPPKTVVERSQNCGGRRKGHSTDRQTDAVAEHRDSLRDVENRN